MMIRYACFVFLTSVTVSSLAINLPGGFERVEVLSGLHDPVTMAFSPDGRLFIAERIDGRLRVAKYTPETDSWALNPMPFASFDVPPSRHRSAGIRGFAFDPDFATNGFLYVFYMKDSQRHNRLVRIQANPANPDMALPGETMLMNLPFNDTASSGSHNGGGVTLGGDGKLYFTTGDGWNGWTQGSESYGAGDNVQSLSTFTGKLFRLNPDGTIPTDNPFFAQTTGDYRAIYALGFRNPYAMTTHPITGQIFVQDVQGPNKGWMLKVLPGDNYLHDGNSGLGTSSLPWADLGNRIIAGGAWYPNGGAFPSTYYGSCFVPLWGSDLIRVVASDTDPTTSDFASSVAEGDRGPTYTEIGTDDFLYYMTTTYETTDGKVYCVRPSGGVSGPTVTVQATDDQAHEHHQDPASLTFTRSATQLDQPLTVLFTVTGTAMPADYTGLTGNITFPSNVSNLVVTVVPVDDPTTEAVEDLTITLQPQPTYVAGVPFTANIVIEDDDLPLRPADTPDFTEPGLWTLSYEASNSTSTADLSSLEPAVGMTNSQIHPSVAHRVDHVGLRFTGYIDVPTNGVYEFSLTSDAGSTLFVGSQLVVDNDGIHTLQTRSGLVGLEQGQHLFELLYIEDRPPAVLDLQVASPGESLQPVPEPWWSHAVDPSPYGLETRPAIAAYLNGVFPEDVTGLIPPLLTQTGVFLDVPSLQPHPGLLGYDVNAPLWSDGAIKQRWAGIPTTATVVFDAIKTWSFPIGTVFVKHFELPVSEVDPSQMVRLETRFFVHGTSGWYGVTYRWREDELEADLLPDSDSRVMMIEKSNGEAIPQTWTFPGRADCLRCHNSLAGPPLGLNTRQLNRDVAYSGGQTDNQLRTWAHIGMFTQWFDEGAIAGYDTLSSLHSAAPLEHRSRSYLDVNCALCHQPDGEGYSTADMRFRIPLPNQGILDVAPSDDGGIDEARLVAPGSPDRSTILLRMQTRAPTVRMPPLASVERDDVAITVIRDWIASLPVPLTVSEVGLEARWRLDAGTGLVALDQTEHGHDASLEGASWHSVDSQASVQFDGIDDYLDAGTWNGSSTGITLACWFYADQLDHLASHDGRLISKASGVQEQDHWWMLSTIHDSGSDRLRFRVKAGGTTSTLIAGAGDVATGTWHHAAATYDGANMVLYLDGTEVGRQPKSGQVAVDSLVPIWLGGNPGSPTERPYRGRLSDVLVYHRGLSAEEIAILAAGAAVVPIVDMDLDGLPDAWEFIYFGSTLPDGSADADLDRLSDLEEWISGTEPDRDTNPYEIRIGKTGVSFLARKADGTGYAGVQRRFSLQSRTGADPEVWQDVPAYTDLLGQDQLVVFPIAGDEFLKCFRVKTWLSSVVAESR